METQKFDTRAGFQACLDDCFSRARLALRLFDPDFSAWELGSSHTDARLRAFLRQGGKLYLVAHSNAHLERNAPRFLRLLQDYSHAIECRVTSRTLQHLTDSFCIGDERDLVRRFHSHFFRGEADFDARSSTQSGLERYMAIWAETNPGLHANVTGL